MSISASCELKMEHVPPVPHKLFLEYQMIVWSPVIKMVLYYCCMCPDKHVVRMLFAEDVCVSVCVE